MNHKTYEELFQEVQADLEQRQRLRPSRVPAMEQVLAKIRGQKNGWVISLGDPSLNFAVRETIQASLATAIEREQQLVIDLDYERAMDKCTALALTPKDVSEALQRLDQILANGNVTLTNVELALHVDKIECFSDGTVRVRTNKLGALHGAQALLEDTETTTPPVCDELAGSTPKARSRRLTRRDLRAAEPGDAIRDLAEFASDRKRFAGLPDKWFWVDEFKIPPKLSWAERNAQEILSYKERLEQSTGEKCTTTMLVAAFSKSRPTILKSLRIARAQRQANAANAGPIQLPQQ